MSKTKKLNESYERDRQCHSLIDKKINLENII